MTTYLHSARSAASRSLNRLADLVKPKSASSALSTTRTTHCSTCRCPDMASKILEEDWHLLIDVNGDPYGPAGIREQARQTAVEYCKHLDDIPNLTRRRRQFTLYASQLTDLSPEHDLGVSYITDAENWTKVQIALVAARCISDFGECPTRASALEYSGTKHPEITNHLKRISAAAEDKANREAGRVEAGTKAKSVPGTNEGGRTMSHDSSGL